MTRTIKAAVLAGTTAIAVFGASAADAATQTAAAKAVILKQITVTKVADLNFGTVVVGTTGGTVGIAAATGARTCAAALTCSGTVGAASFTIAGSKGEIVNISSDTSVSLNTAPVGTAMTASLTSSAATATLSATGAGAFTVGGTLTVAASQPDGSYSGNFNVTVDYQ